MMMNTSKLVVACAGISFLNALEINAAALSGSSGRGTDDHAEDDTGTDDHGTPQPDDHGDSVVEFQSTPQFNQMQLTEVTEDVGAPPIEVVDRLPEGELDPAVVDAMEFVRRQIEDHGTTSLRFMARSMERENADGGPSDELVREAINFIEDEANRRALQQEHLANAMEDNRRAVDEARAQLGLTKFVFDFFNNLFSYGDLTSMQFSIFP